MSLVWQGGEPLIRLEFTVDEAEDLAYLYGSGDGAFMYILDEVAAARAAVEARDEGPGLAVVIRHRDTDRPR